MKISMAISPSKATFAPLLFAGDVERGIRRAAELGYDAVELNIQNPDLIDVGHLIASLKSYGLRVSALGTGQAYIEEGLSLASANPEVLDRVINRLKSHIRFAGRVGAQVVIGGIRGKLHSDKQVRRIEYKNSLACVQECAEFAAQYGVTLTVEPINRYETNFINTVEEGLAFLSDLGDERVKLCLDTFHMNIEEASFAASIKAAKYRLSHIHLVDSNRRAPGQGHIDFAVVLHALREIGYDGYLVAEILPIPDDDTAASQNIDYLKKSWRNDSSDCSEGNKKGMTYEI